MRLICTKCLPRTREFLGIVQYHKDLPLDSCICASDYMLKCVTLNDKYFVKCCY